MPDKKNWEDNLNILQRSFLNVFLYTILFLPCFCSHKVCSFLVKTFFRLMVSSQCKVLSLANIFKYYLLRQLLAFVAKSMSDINNFIISSSKSHRENHSVNYKAPGLFMCIELSFNLRRYLAYNSTNICGITGRYWFITYSPKLGIGTVNMNRQKQ